MQLVYQNTSSNAQTSMSFIQSVGIFVDFRFKIEHLILF